MTKFQEQFPSFNKDIFVQSDQFKDWQELLMERCVDKQKVKEIIDKFLSLDLNYTFKIDEELKQLIRKKIETDLGL